MSKVIIVAGSALKQIEKVIEFERGYNKIQDLVDDIFDYGEGAFLDIDKILILQNGFDRSGGSSELTQLLEVQGAMDMFKLRSNLYFLLNDAELYKLVGSDDSYLIYRNFNMLLFETLGFKAIQDVINGRYDAEGIYHPDFLRKNEIDAQLDAGIEKLSSEEVEDDVVEVVEVYDDFVDSDEKEKERKKLEEEAKKKLEEEQKEKARLEKFKKLEEEKRRREELERKKKEESERRKRSSERRKSRTIGRRKTVEVIDKDFADGVIAVTGDRQSGVSTTVANMAKLYASVGKSVLIVDLDIKRRFQPRLFPDYEDALSLDSRISHSLLVSLINARNLGEVVAGVDDNISLITVHSSVERPIQRFANRDISEVFNGANLVNLFSYARSVFDVVLVDFPFEVIQEVGHSLSYVDHVLLCVKNTEYHLDNLLTIEVEGLLLENDIVANTLLSKSKLLLTHYNRASKMGGAEVSPVFVTSLLSNLEESYLHLDVVGKVPYSDRYEEQFLPRGKKIVELDKDIEAEFIKFMNLLI